MPPNYQFKNVICYIYLLTLLTNGGIYANSVAACHTSPISLSASTLFDKVGLLAFKTSMHFALKALVIV